MVDKSKKRSKPVGTKRPAGVRYSAVGHPFIQQLMAEQGTGPVTDVGLLHGDFGPKRSPSRSFSKPSANGEDTKGLTGQHE